MIMHADPTRRPAAAHVLLVEDHDDLAALLEIYLRHEGHEVTWVRDGRDALLAIARRMPDLLVLDLGLPRLGGLAVLEQLRDGGCDVPVLVLSGRHGDEDKLEAFRLGADDYVTKPFHTKELMARVRALLRRAKWTYPRALPSERDDVVPITRHAAPAPRDRARIDRAERDLAPRELAPSDVAPPDAMARRFGLTARESEIARLMAAGLSNPEIARALRISRFTARNHVRNVLAKLSVATRGRAAAVLLGA